MESTPKLTQKKIFEFFTKIRNFLHKFVGDISGRPLAYVVRDKVEIPNSLTDPPYGQPGSEYAQILDEVKRRCPIRVYVNNVITTNKDRYFVHDNSIVWEILENVLKDTMYITYIKSYAKAQDGRAAFKQLHTQLLGTEAINNYASAAERKLQELVLDGKPKKAWGFDKYVLAHKEQHIILEKLKSQYGHAGLDEHSMIRHFMTGITDPKLETVKGSLACNHGAKTFDSVVTSYRTYRSSTRMDKKGNHTSLNISEISATGNRSAGRETKIGEAADGYTRSADYAKHKIAQRFYKAKEWNALTKGQRNFLRSKSPNKNKRKAPGGKSDETATLKKQLKVMKVALQELQTEVTGKALSNVSLDDTSSSDDSVVVLPTKKTKRVKIAKKSR